MAQKPSKKLVAFHAAYRVYVQAASALQDAENVIRALRAFKVIADADYHRAQAALWAEDAKRKARGVARGAK